MQTKGLNRQIFRLAIPNIISNLSVPLLSSVDTALVGRLSEPYYIGAVAVGAIIFNFLYWGFGFLRMGTTGLTAQAYGAGDQSAIMHVLGRALFVAVIGGLLLIILQWPIAKLSFFLVEGSSEVERHARSYFNIRIFAAPATLSLYALQGWFLGMQNARYPMILTITTNFLNIAFTAFFILSMGMKADGVALGTLCAQYTGIVIAVFLFLKRYRSCLQYLQMRLLLATVALKAFFLLNGDIFIRTLLLIFAFAFFTAKSAAFGDRILAANSILMQLWMVFSYGIDGFAFAAESLVGKVIGQKNRQLLHATIRRIFFWGVLLGGVFSITYFSFDRFILSLYTDQTAVINLALAFMGWTVAAPLINSFCYIWDGIYIGATASRAMRDSMIVATLLFFLPVYYWAHGQWGNHGIWLAMVLFMAVRGISLTLMAKKHIFKRI